MQELAQTAKGDEVKITIKNGIFEVSGESSDAEDLAEEANMAMDRLLKFQQFGPDKSKGRAALRTELISMQWPRIQEQATESSNLIDIGLSPEAYQNSNAWISVGIPVFMMNAKERAKYKEIDPAQAHLNNTKKRKIVVKTRPTPKRGQ